MSASTPVYLITGGNNGIGLAACDLLASKGNSHVIMGSRSLDKGKTSISEIQAKYPSSTISLVQLDITSDDSISAAVKHIEAEHGRLDALVNNAGICSTTFSRSILRDTLDTNVTSQAAVTEAFAHLLAKSNAPRVIYVTSILGSISFRNDPANPARDQSYKAYRISKAALNMLVACDTWEHQDFRVFAFCPGYVISDLAGMREWKIKAGIEPPDGSARGIAAILEGQRDEEAGKFLHGEKAGMLYEW